MLNRIIRLQALLEIISNQSTLTIDLLNAQAKQMRTMIYQNRLALDYLLAEEGGVCGKFNSSECCIEIDDHSEVITNITTNIRKLAHVPVQKWTPLIQADWENWWNNLLKGDWWKKLLIVLSGALISVIFLPCMIPCLIRVVTRTVINSLELTLKSGKKENNPKDILMLQEQEMEANSVAKTEESATETYRRYQKLRQLSTIEEEIV